MKVLITLSLVVFALGGCASKSTVENMQKDLAQANEIREKAEETRLQKKQKLAEEFLDSRPIWAVEIPKPDTTGLYAVGSAESSNYNVSLKKAMLDGEFGLAKAYKQELSGSERSYTQERNDRNLNTQYTALIDKLVARVPVVGFEVVKQEVKAIHGAYQSWVLLKLPYVEFNKVMQEQAANSMDSKVREAFDDLDRRVKTRIADRLNEQQVEQDMKLKEMKAQSELGKAGVVTPKSKSATGIDFSEGPGTETIIN